MNVPTASTKVTKTRSARRSLAEFFVNDVLFVSFVSFAPAVSPCSVK
jgi:hypothetical protein